jgi:coenzyme F420-dependent glucose-6-phosphate dehydrogenase
MAVEIGYSLSCEEHRPEELVKYARQAEEAGFTYASISDHFHPWVGAQGNSPFVWSVLGGIAQSTTTLRVGTGVTCPTMRYHPAVIAQAAATVACMMPGRFFLGIGTGENLNEHVVGARWPSYGVRASMMEEAVDIIRRLWTGSVVEHHGPHYTVENARLYTLPEDLPEVVVAASGPKSAALAGRIGDGMITFTPDETVVQGFRDAGGQGAHTYLQVNVCWDTDEARARRTAHRICGNVALPGELGNQLPSPKHYEQAVSIVDEDAVAKVIECGSDPDRHAARIQQAIDAGFDRVHVYQVGPDQEGFFRFYEREILPRFAV